MQQLLLLLLLLLLLPIFLVYNESIYKNAVH